MAKKTAKKKAAPKKKSATSKKRPRPAVASKKTAAKRPGSETTVAKNTAASAAAKSPKKSAKKATAPKSAKRTTVTKPAGGVSGNGKGTTATSLDPVQFPEKPAKKVKTWLSAKQLREFKALLEQKRAELCGDVERLTSEALHKDGEGGGEHTAMPIHMADVGTDNWEQDFTLGLIANEEAVVREIDEALDRIASKTYGICIATQEPIAEARLRAKPWAKYCIEYARMRDEGRLR